MIKKVIMVFKTHFDIGFTDHSKKVLEQYSGPMLRDVIKTCKDTTDMGDLKFVWTMPAWPLYDMLDNAEPSLKENLHTLVAEERIAWHALPYTIHTDFSTTEEIIAGLRYGKELSGRFNLPMKKTAKMTDVPGHGRILPTILTGAGVEFLHLGSNEFATTPDVPFLFNWEGPDGSKLLTMYVSDGYGSSLLPPDDWEYPVWIAFMHTHDNIGPQNAESIRALAAEVTTAFPDAEVVTGTMEDFYSDLSQCDLSGVPTVKKDLADHWIHGVGTYPKEVSMVRDTRKDITNLEKLSAFAGNDVTGITNQIYDNLGLFSEHTWGVDIKTWLDPNRVYDKDAFSKELATPKYKYVEASWDEQRERAINADTLAKKALSNLKTEEELTVFNPNGSDFSGWAEVTDNKHIEGSVPVFGKEHLYVSNASPLSVTSYVKHAGDSPLVITKMENDMVTAENHRYILHFSEKSGAITQLFDKTLNAPILKENNGKTVFEYDYNKYGNKVIDKFLDDFGKIWSDWGIKDNGRTDYPECEDESFPPQFDGWVQKEHSLVFSFNGTGTKAYGDAEKITLTVTLPPLGNEVFVQLDLAGKQATPFVETGSIVFPLASSAPKYRFNKIGNELDPKKDIARNANHVYYCLESYAAAEDNTAGVCIVTHDTPLASIGETGMYQFRSEYQEKNPQIYFNLFNNMWGTNFPQWMKGGYTFRYTLFGYKPAENLMNRALSLYEGAKIGNFPVCSPPVTLPDGVQVLSFAEKDDGKILHLRDTTGTNRMVTITSTGGELLEAVNLQNQSLFYKKESSLELSLPKFGIIAIKIF